MRGKKADEMWWIIIGAVLAIVVFLVLFFIIIPGISRGSHTITDPSACESSNGKCFADKQDGMFCPGNEGCPDSAKYCCYTK